MKKIFAIIITLPIVIFGAEWQSLNGPPAGRADDMSMGLYEGVWVIYAADQTHKLYKSVNEGEHWDSLTYYEVTKNPTCVITEPNNAQVVYIGKHDATPVWKSTDGGQTWEPKSYGITNNQPLCFAMDPLFSNRIYVGCQTKTNDYSLFFSSDGGNNWYGRGIQNVAVNCINVIHETANPESIFIATSSGIYLSTDGGVNWFLRQAGNFLSICNYVNGVGVRIYYAVGDGRIYKSADGTGSDWVLLSGSPLYSKKVMVQSVAPYYVFCASSNYVYRSTDEGATWAQIKYHFSDPHTLCVKVHPSNQSILFVGTEECLYKSVDAGNTWQEKTVGFKIADKGYDLSLALPNAIFVSYNGTTSWKLESSAWTLRFTYPPSSNVPPERGGNNGDILVDDDVEHNYVYVTSEVKMGVDADYICRSTDGGWTWENVTPSGLLLNHKSIALDPIYNNKVYIVGESAPQFLKSTDYGVTWELHPIYYGTAQPSFYSIDLSNSEPQAIYLGDVNYGVAKSTDGGSNWDFYNDGLPGTRINAIAIDPDIPAIIYAGTTNGIYKSTDYGATWFDLGLVEYPYVTDIEIDPEEPTIIYGICKQNAPAEENYVICSVDRGGAGFYNGYGLPTSTYDIEIDRHYPEVVYAATNQGVYSYTPDFNKHLVSSSAEATFGNNGRKLLRVAGTNELWVCYESGGIIYAVHSTDAGETWSKKLEIGEGNYPAISIRDVPDYPPCVVWLKKNEQDTIYFARYVSENKWSTPEPIVVSSPIIDFGPPSFMIGSDNYGRVAYSAHNNETNMDNVYYGQFYVFDPGLIIPEQVGSGINPCIGFMPQGNNNPEIHIVWQNNSTIYYRSRTIGGVWGNQETVYTNGANPFLEITGSVIYVVFEASGDIKGRHATYTQNGQHTWSRVWQVCATPNPSTYPVLTTGNACAWVEEILGNKEICFSYRTPETDWVKPINISRSPASSNYPHITHKQTFKRTTVYFGWTENNEPPYEIRFNTYTFGGSNPDGALAYYTAEGGDTIPSPFNLHREGYLRYGTEPYKKIDYDPAYLEYQFKILNPERDYVLAAYAYQEGYGNLPITVKVDNILITGITLPPDTLIICKKMLPLSLYTDSAVNVKIFGNEAVCAALALYEYEKESGERGGGPQTVGNSQINELSLNIFPDPAHKEFTIQYALPKETSINLSIFDISGRLVNTLINAHQQAGSYCKVFDTKDLSQGVYFIRLHNNDKSIVKKVVFLR